MPYALPEGTGLPDGLNLRTDLPEVNQNDYWYCVFAISIDWMTLLGKSSGFKFFQRVRHTNSTDLIGIYLHSSGSTRIQLPIFHDKISNIRTGGVSVNVKIIDNIRINFMGMQDVGWIPFAEIAGESQQHHGQVNIIVVIFYLILITIFIYYFGSSGTKFITTIFPSLATVANAFIASKKHAEVMAEFAALSLSIEELSRGMGILFSGLSSSVGNVDNDIGVVDGKVDSLITEHAGLDSKIDLIDSNLDGLISDLALTPDDVKLFQKILMTVTI